MSTEISRVAELERALRVAEAERDELASDVERLCLQSGSTFPSAKFDPDGERMRETESALRKLKLTLADVESERDQLQSELQQAKAVSEELSTRCMVNEQRAAQALAFRDAEVASLKAAAKQTEAELSRATGELELSKASTSELQGHLGDLKSELAVLRQEQKRHEGRNQAEEAESMQLRSMVQQLEDAGVKLRAQLTEVQAEASHTHKLLKQAHKIEDQLSSQVQELQAALAVAKHGQQQQQASSRRQSGSAGGSDEQASRLAVEPPSSPCAAAAAAAHSPAPSPRAAAARALTAATAAAVTVTSAEAGAVESGHSAAQNTAGTATEAAQDAADARIKQAVAAEIAEAASVTAAAVAAAGQRVRELEAELTAAREELERERAAHVDEREQLQLLSTMVHDFKIKLAQATQEKVEALMRAAQLTHEAGQQAAQHAGSGGGGGGIAILSRMGSTLSASQREREAQHSRRASRDRDMGLSRSPSNSANLVPAGSAPTPGGQPATKSLWAAWIGGGVSSLTTSTAAPVAAAAAAVAVASTNAAAVPSGASAFSPAPAGAGGGGGGGGPGSAYAASAASEESYDLDGGAAAGSSTTSAAANAAAAAATAEAAEGRNRRLAAQLERVRAQLAAIDKLAGHMARCLTQLRGCSGLLWSGREEDAPRRWAALRDLTRLAEECGTLRAEAGLPPPSSPPAHGATGAAAGPDGVQGMEAGGLPPLVPLAVATGGGGSANHLNQGPGGSGGGREGSDNDSSLVCTRESGGVQRRVAEVLMGAVEFGVRSLEQYNHQSALSSVSMYG